MEVPVAEAVEQLSELIRRAEEGDDIVLTCEGRPAVRLVPVPAPRRKRTPEEKRLILDDILERVRASIIPGPSSAEIQAEMYDEFGLPK